MVAYRPLYFQPGARLPNEMAVLAVNPLLRDHRRMALWPLGQAGSGNLHTGIIEEELAQAPRESWQLPLPSDGRLTGWLREIKRGDTLPRRAQPAGRTGGASDKTIGRIFMRETGMSYRAWRQQWRLLRAMELLAEAEPISRVAAAWVRQRQRLHRLLQAAHGADPLRYLNSRDESHRPSSPPTTRGLPGPSGEVVDGLCHHVMGGLLLQGHLLLPGGAVQLGSGVLGGHGIQAQAAGNPGVTIRIFIWRAPVWLR